MLSHHQTTKEFDNPDLEYWYKEATLSNQPYLVPDPSAKPKVYADYPKYCSSDLKQDVLTCVEIAASRGLETLVLDQTRPDIGLSVVKVIVPGLRHFWARFAPGRLYDVPVQMGWLPAPLTEEQLNPIPMFF
jgi:ribosomal protein S12 methylthiotransferase accessory factor